MVLDIGNFFSASNVKKNRPLITEYANFVSAVNGAQTRYGPYSNWNPAKFWLRFKNSVELQGTIQIPITDIMGDRPEWTSPDGSQLSKQERVKAERFWRNNRGKETVTAMLFDGFFTGNGYLWNGTSTDQEIKEAVMKAIGNITQEMSVKEVREIYTSAIMDEDLKASLKFDYIASSTVRILNDDYDIIAYEQISKGKVERFPPSKVIHYRYMTVNGMVTGFCPIEALTAEIMLLTLIKGNMTSVLRNGGAPDKIFSMPKEMAKSKNHDYLVEQLSKYKPIQNRHGSLVFTGELAVHDLQGNLKDMEYQNLALYVISNIAFVYGIPATRIPYLIGSQAAKDSGGAAEVGYWNKISSCQDNLEDLLNSQLFEKLGWHIKFPRKYKQDEVREAQTQSMKADTIEKYQTICANIGVQPKREKVLQMLGWNEEDVETLKNEGLDNSGMKNQNMLDNGKIMDNPGKQNKDQRKANSANQKGSGEAMTQP